MIDSILCNFKKLGNKFDPVFEACAKKLNYAIQS